MGRLRPSFSLRCTSRCRRRKVPEKAFETGGLGGFVDGTPKCTPMATPRDPLEAPLSVRARNTSLGSPRAADTAGVAMGVIEEEPEVGEGMVTGDAVNEAMPSPKKKHLLFLGDSLFCGVGEEDLSNGPALPRTIASCVATKLGILLQWRAFASDGGHLEMLEEKQCPALYKEMERIRSKGEELMGVVLMSSLNDWKKVLQNGKTPSRFYEHLTRLVETFRSKATPSTRIYLPVLPIEWGSAFPNPMKQFAIGVSGLWDKRKDQVAQEQPGVVVIEKPPTWAKLRGCLGRDGLHPTELGYKVWGTHIAAKMLPTLVDQDGRRLYRAPKTKGARGGMTPRSPSGVSAVVGSISAVAVNPLGQETVDEDEDEGEV